MHGEIKSGEARRYLSILIVINDEMKSDLMELKELSAEKEYSIEFRRSPAGRQMSSVRASESAIEQQREERKDDSVHIVESISRPARLHNS